MLKRPLGAVGRLALAAFIAWALTIVTTNIARSLGLRPVLILLLTFTIVWVILRRSNR